MAKGFHRYSRVFHQRVTTLGPKFQFRALRSSNPCPMNWASHEMASDLPRKRNGTFSAYCVWLPEAGRFSGHEVPASDPPDWTSSGMEMSMIPWPPVWEPETPTMPRTCRDMPWPAGRGNLLRSKV